LLASFLSVEKSAAFLAAVAHKALRVLYDEEGEGAFDEGVLQARAGIMQEGGFVAMQHNPHAAATAVMLAAAIDEASGRSQYHWYARGCRFVGGEQ
jgi:hypothetical protein